MKFSISFFFLSFPDNLLIFSKIDAKLWKGTFDDTDGAIVVYIRKLFSLFIDLKIYSRTIIAPHFRPKVSAYAGTKIIGLEPPGK